MSMKIAVKVNDLDYLLRLNAETEVMSFFPSGVRSYQEIENNIKYLSCYYKIAIKILLPCV